MTCIVDDCTAPRWENRTSGYCVKHQRRVDRHGDALKATTGIDLRHAWKHDLERLRVAWQLTRESAHLDGLVANLRRTADALDAAIASEVAP